MNVDVVEAYRICRLCGKKHNKDIQHKLIPQLLQAQIQFEDFELFMDDVHMSIVQRTDYETLLIWAKDALGIPREKIFIKEHSPNVHDQSVEEQLSDARKLLEEINKTTIKGKFVTNGIQKLTDFLKTVPVRLSTEKALSQYITWLQSLT